eukprot:TRINITY_DN2238_c0_g1_i1.p1 TRINITY_DN2238_c0_g1~~TRINITY_DN2238_c0_g1_i1.p1  ORF type:complete len:434 (-),score=92.13 TRINITY_DN2238_c0_g1_i1:313-1614(-)
MKFGVFVVMVLGFLVLLIAGMTAGVIHLRHQLKDEEATFQLKMDSLARYQVKQVMGADIGNVRARLDFLEHERNQLRFVKGLGEVEERLMDLEGRATRIPDLRGDWLDDWRRGGMKSTGQFAAMKKALLPNDEDRLIVVWQAPHKGGSTILTDVMRNFCNQMRLPVYTHMSPWITHGVLQDVHWGLTPDADNHEDPKERASKSLVHKVPERESACVGVVRNFDEPPPLPRTVYKVISMMRDPRDMITSAYFSFGWTHSFAAENDRIRKMTVDQFALTEKPAPWGAIEVGTAKFYKYLFKPLLQNRKNGDRLLIAYDQVILSYLDLLESVASFLKMPKGPAELIYHATCCTTSESPTRMLHALARGTRGENTGSHIRSYLPGSYRQRLSEGANRELQDRFAEELRLIQSVWSWDAYSSFPPPELADFSGVTPHK